MDIIKVFGDNLKKHRKAMGISQEAFADKCGMHRTYPENVFYEYKTLTESYAPQKNSVHYKVTTSSYSAIKVPKGMTVYTPTGVYKAQ